MIIAKALSYSYQDGTKRIPALEGIDLHIKRGEWVAITGSNGSGKSTLARTFNGLLVPKAGEIEAAGYPLNSAKNRELVKHKIQLVFQNPDAQMVGTTVLEDIAFGLENRSISRAEMMIRIEKVLGEVGLTHKVSAPVSSLSGGERQRLAIAGCLAVEPECLILDEATSMLDPLGRKEIYALVRSLWKKGMTVVWVTQNLEELLEAGRVVVMEQGRLAYSGDARTLFYDSMLPHQFKWELPPVIRVGLLLKEKGIPVPALPLDEGSLDELLCG